MKSNLLLAIGLLFFLFSSCTSDNEEDLFPSTDCDTNNVSFSADIMPIIDASCAVVGCHVQGGGGNGVFENYNNIKAKIDNGSFAKRLLTDQDMPPSGPLSSCQMEHVQAWIDAGAPNN